jgi:hypothetical protein
VVTNAIVRHRVPRYSSPNRFIFVFMVAMTTRTQMQVSFWDFPLWQPQYASNPWPMGTLWDAYFGLIPFFVWLCYKRLSTPHASYVRARHGTGQHSHVGLRADAVVPTQSDEPVANVITRHA